MRARVGASRGGRQRLKVSIDGSQIRVRHDLKRLPKPDGTELKTFRDIGFDPTDGSVYAVCEAPLARIWAQQKHLRSRVIGTRAGLDHVIAVFETVTGP